MEHLKELDTVKAIGGSNADIHRILAEQSVIAAVLGFAVGTVFTLAVGPGMEKAGLKRIRTPDFGAVVLVGTFLLCLAASRVSFRKVAALDPALVFHGGIRENQHHSADATPSSPTRPLSLPIAAARVAEAEAVLRLAEVEIEAR